MPRLNITPRTALILFCCIAFFLFAQAVWWIMLMAKLLDEKVELATELGADRDYIEVIQAEEVSRQMMVGTEGVFFLLLVLIGAWIIYRALVINERLKFAQQNFLMGVTHELKTPLASMKIYLDTLKSDKIPNEKKLEIIPRLKSDVDRLEQLVENILEAGRFEKSGYKIHKELFDLVQLLNYSADTLKDHSLKKELVINKNGFPDELMFFGDRYALKRAIESILENSLKYSDKDKIEVDLTLVHDSKNISLMITDNGIGLEKKDIPMIFERFYRAGQVINQSKPGTGLGLFLAREIIKAHGGEIFAQSDGIGAGVQFTIQLKVMKQHENNIVS